jgi:hypothetical protein
MSIAAIADSASVNVAEAFGNFAEGYQQVKSALSDANDLLANADPEIRNVAQSIVARLHEMLKQGVFAMNPSAIRELVGELQNVKAKSSDANGADNSPQAQLRRAEAAYREATERYKSDLARARDVGLISDTEYREHNEKIDQLNKQLDSAQTPEAREALMGQIAQETRDMERKVEEERQRRERDGTLTSSQAGAADAVGRSSADVRNSLDDLNQLTQANDRESTPLDHSPRYAVAEVDGTCQLAAPSANLSQPAHSHRVCI